MARTLIIAFLATLATTLVLANDLKLGGPEPNDHSVKSATVIRKPKFDSQRATVVLGDGSEITSIRAVDHDVTNNATVSVVEGGLGHPEVVLYFDAPPLRGMNFTVEVKGVLPPKPTPTPKPTTTPRPSKPTTTPQPPKPTTTRRTPKPTTTRRPSKPTTTRRPSKPTTTSRPSKPTTTPRPSKPTTTPRPSKPTTTSQPPKPTTTPSPPSTTEPPAESTTESAPPAQSTASEEEVEKNEEEARLLNQIYYANTLF